jgi:hypothetical protein
MNIDGWEQSVYIGKRSGEMNIVFDPQCLTEILKFPAPWPVADNEELCPR